MVYFLNILLFQKQYMSQCLLKALLINGTPSSLFVYHCCNKELHISALQRYSAAAFRDGLDLPTIKDLASLASWGKFGGNVERDLFRMVPSMFGSEFPLHSVCIDIYNPDTASIQEMEVPVMLASDVLHTLWMKQSPKLWEIMIGANSKKCKAFWSAFATTYPTAANHPVIQFASSIEILL